MNKYTGNPKNRQMNRRHFLSETSTAIGALIAVMTLLDEGDPEAENPVPAGLAQYAASVTPKNHWPNFYEKVTIEDPRTGIKLVGSLQDFLIWADMMGNNPDEASQYAREHGLRAIRPKQKADTSRIE